MYKPYLVGLLKKLFGEPNRMNDKEKLEAIKQVLSDTPARSGDDKETAAWYEKALDEIDKIIESNDHADIFALSQIDFSADSIYVEALPSRI